MRVQHTTSATFVECVSLPTLPLQQLQQPSVLAALGGSIWDGVDAAKCPKGLPPDWVKATESRAFRYAGLGAPSRRMVKTRTDVWRVHLNLPLSSSVRGKSLSERAATAAAIGVQVFGVAAAAAGSSAQQFARALQQHGLICALHSDVPCSLVLCSYSVLNDTSRVPLITL